MTRVKVAFFSVVCSLFAVAFADVFPVPEYGYVIDFPEGFSLDDGSEDLSLLLFRHTMLPVEVMTKVWASGAYASSSAALQGTFAKIGAQGEIASFRWRNQNCAIAKITMQNAALNGQHSGWACVVPLIGEKKGWLTVLAYAPADVAYDCEQFLISVLDSVMTDAGSYRECGIVTSYAFQSGVKKELHLTIAGKEISTQIGGEDAEAAQFVIDREWAVFLLFAETEYAIEAWQRFSYARASKTEDKADFAPLPAILEGESSDCDSRSMLVAVLLRHMGVDACIFVSPVYSHAMLGVALPDKQGQTIHVDGTEYLVGETTAKDVTIGMLDSAMQDRDKWLPVMFND